MNKIKCAGCGREDFPVVMEECKFCHHKFCMDDPTCLADHLCQGGKLSNAEIPDRPIETAEKPVEAYRGIDVPPMNTPTPIPQPDAPTVIPQTAHIPRYIPVRINNSPAPTEQPNTAQGNALGNKIPPEPEALNGRIKRRRGMAARKIQRSDGVVYPDATAAAKAMHVHHTAIRRSCTTGKTCDGYTWKYLPNGSLPDLPKKPSEIQFNPAGVITKPRTGLDDGPRLPYHTAAQRKALDPRNGTKITHPPDLFELLEQVLQLSPAQWAQMRSIVDRLLT